MPAFETMNLVGVVEWLNASGEGSQEVPGSALMSAFRRLIDIAYLEHGITGEEAELAAKVADVLKRTILAGGNEQMNAAFEAAVAAHHNQVKIAGRGTVVWQLEEEKLQRS